MTLILQKPSTAPDRGQTHVLVIGVGYYHHLRGGNGQRFYDDMGLGQLTSPPISARTFAEWIVNEFENEEAPLGSVEILLSEKLDSNFLIDGNNIPIEQANLGNIREAFRRWYRRCNSHSNNVAIFYFCGHGVMIGGDSILLAENFGADEDLPYETAINIDKQFRAMPQCKANTQCFFIDSCSTMSVDGLDVEDVGAKFFIPPKRLISRNPSRVIFKASAPGGIAGANNSTEVSRFTQALLESLAGVGCRKEEGRWIVNIPSLLEGAHRTLKRLTRQGDEPQVPGGDHFGEGRLIVRQNPPTVPVVLRFSPRDAIINADLLLQSISNPSWFIRRDSTCRSDLQNEWEVKVKTGSYRLTAHFESHRYKDLDERITILPLGHEPDPIQVEVSI